MINTYDFKIQHPREFAQLAVRDLLFLFYKCPQVDKLVKIYSHYNKIMFVMDGRRKVHHREKSWDLTHGKAILMKKTAYQQERFAEEEWEVLCFYFPDSFMQQTYKEFRSSLTLKNLPPPSPDVLLEINVSESTLAFFYSVLPYFTQQPPPAASLLELKFKELLFNLYLDPANKELLSYVNSISESSKPSLQEIMDANYTYNLSLAEFARLSHRSLAAFKREFTQVYHTTPGKWLIKTRLDYASHLLETSCKNIKEITDECGFENATHFSRVFRERFGMPPFQYRKNKTLACTA